MPDGGTVAFKDGTATIPGCGSQPVDTATGNASCQLTYGSTGTHAITAVYSGDAAFVTSTSSPLGQQVAPGPPTAQIGSPRDHQTFALGEHVATSLSCSEGVGGPGLASCKDSAAPAPRRARSIPPRQGSLPYSRRSRQRRWQDPQRQHHLHGRRASVGRRSNASRWRKVHPGSGRTRQLLVPGRDKRPGASVLLGTGGGRRSDRHVHCRRARVHGHRHKQGRSADPKDGRLRVRCPITGSPSPTCTRGRAGPCASVSRSRAGGRGRAGDRVAGQPSPMCHC